SVSFPARHATRLFSCTMVPPRTSPHFPCTTLFRSRLAMGTPVGHEGHDLGTAIRGDRHRVPVEVDTGDRGGGGTEGLIVGGITTIGGQRLTFDGHLAERLLFVGVPAHRRNGNGDDEP